MSDINNQTKSLNNIAEVQELDNETAAAIQGGYALEVYRHANLKDKLGSFNHQAPRLSSNANDQISSVKINAGVWRFYEHGDYQGRFWEAGPKDNTNTIPSWINDRISSLKRVA